MSNNNTTSQAHNYTYTIDDYPSNVEVYVKVEDSNGEFISGGRCAIIECTGDSPKWENEEDWGEEKKAMTRGAELGSFLRGLSGEELRNWLEVNNEGNGIDHL